MLLVDKRERMLAEVLRQTDVEFVLQTLPVGDVMWQETVFFVHTLSRAANDPP